VFVVICVSILIFIVLVIVCVAKLCESAGTPEKVKKGDLHSASVNPQIVEMHSAKDSIASQPKQSSDVEQGVESELV